MSSAIPAPPGAAVTLFGPAIGLAERFTSLLATHGVERGLIGPREVPRLWERHLLNCGALAELIPDEAEVVDIGSRGWAPGPGDRDAAAPGTNDPARADATAYGIPRGMRRRTWPRPRYGVPWPRGGYGRGDPRGYRYLAGGRSARPARGTIGRARSPGRDDPGAQGRSSPVGTGPGRDGSAAPRCAERRSSEGGPGYRRTTGHGRPYSDGRPGAGTLTTGRPRLMAKAAPPWRCNRPAGPSPERRRRPVGMLVRRGAA